MPVTQEKSDQTVQNAAIRMFDFLKSTTHMNDLWTKAIPLAEDAGFLLPVCELHTHDDALIKTFGEWREAAYYAYPTQFPVTDEGTRSWLRHRLLDVPNRMLFLIVDKIGTPVGHVGFANVDNEDGDFELDNLLRGSLKGHREITRLATEALLNWAQDTLGPNGFYLRVLASLKQVIKFDQRLGFEEVSRTPLRKKVEGEVTSYVPVAQGDHEAPDDWFIRMEYCPRSKWDSSKMILTAGPSISAVEASYAHDATVNGWNGQWNKYLRRFEQSFAEYVGRKYAIATSSCTGALHLSLLSLGIGPGDEVIVPETTWVATANAVLYVGATPVFADIEPDTWCMDPHSVEALITEKTKAIMPVHLYGHPARMAPIMEVARKHNLFVVEDAAPAIGAEVNGRKAGTFGEFACFSFQGAKLLVTGEGGMLVTDSDDLYQRALSLWDQGRDPHRTFWISDQGWKYKMSNVQAAIGLGQLERVDELVHMKRRLFSWYEDGLQGVPGIRLNNEAEYAKSIYWMSSLELAEGIDREAFRAELKARNVDTRPVFPAISQYPVWPVQHAPKPVARRVGDQALNLPSGVCLRREQVEYVCEQIRALMEDSRFGRAVA